MDYITLSKKMVAKASKAGISRQDSEDIVSNVWVSFFGVENLVEETRYGFLWDLLSKKIADFRRERKALRHAKTQALGEFSPMANTGSAYALLVETVREGVIASAITDQQAAILIAIAQGENQFEIAQALGISSAHCSNLKDEAIEKLRKS